MFQQQFSIVLFSSWYAESGKREKYKLLVHKLTDF